MSGQLSLREPDRTDADLPVRTPLFRAQVIAERQTQGLGPVLLEPRVSYRMITAFAGGAALLLVVFLFFGSYTRTERVTGWLVPDRGVVLVVPPRAGVVTSIAVKEGQTVAQGDPLMTISSETHTAAFGSTGEEVLSRLQQQRTTLIEQKTRDASLADGQVLALAQRLEALEHQKALLHSEIELQRSRIVISAETLSRLTNLLQKQLSTKSAVSAAAADNIEQTARLQDLQRTLSQVEVEIASAETEQRVLPDQLATKLAQTDRSIAELDQQIALADASRGLVIVAPQAGTVSGLQVELGGAVVNNVPALTIIPEGATLYAQMFAPNRAAGFLRAGQSVLLRYHSYPYQHFGLHSGSIESVTATAMTVGELPQQLAGLSKFYEPGESFYRVSVGLADQTIDAYGSDVRLRSGMQLDADIIVEKHSLIEWVLYPLFAGNGKWTL